MTKTTRPEQKPEETRKQTLPPQKTWTGRLQETPPRHHRSETRINDDDEDANREGRHTAERSTRQKQETDQKPTDRKSHRAEKKNMCPRRYKRRNKTCPPREQTKKINEITEEEQGRRRRHTVWGDIGLTEYNPRKKWECRFEDCRREIDGELLTFYRRNKKSPGHNLARHKQQHALTEARPIAQLANYSCASNYYRSKAPEHCKFPKLQTEDPPKGKMDRDASQNER